VVIAERLKRDPGIVAKLEHLIRAAAVIAADDELALAAQRAPRHTEGLTPQAVACVEGAVGRSSLLRYPGPLARHRHGRCTPLHPARRVTGTT
jgi:hypothetical protein